MDACDSVIVRCAAVTSATAVRQLEGFSLLKLLFSGAAAASCVFEAGVVLRLILPAVPQSTAV